MFVGMSQRKYKGKARGMLAECSRKACKKLASSACWRRRFVRPRAAAEYNPFLGRPEPPVLERMAQATRTGDLGELCGWRDKLFTQDRADENEDLRTLVNTIREEHAGNTDDVCLVFGPGDRVRTENRWAVGPIHAGCRF